MSEEDGDWADDSGGDGWGDDAEGGDGWGDDGEDGDGDGDGWGDDGGDEFEFVGQKAEEEAGTAVKLKNLAWEAESEMQENPERALELYREVFKMSIENADDLNDELHSFVFGGLKNSTIILFRLKKHAEMLEEYNKTMQYFEKVSHNESNKAVELILNILSRGNQDEKDADIREKVYARTINHLSTMPGKQSMAFSIQMRQAVEYVQTSQFDKATSLLEKLHATCKLKDGSDDLKKGSELIDIYALQMRMAGETGDMDNTKELYEKTKNLDADVKNPKSQSIIRECWGKMWGDEGNWQKAYQDFYLAFTTNQEAGYNDKAKQCLTYVIVANMLSGGVQNPFDAREAQVFQKEKEMEPVINIRKAKEKRDVKAFASALEDFDKTWGDEWIKKHMQSMIADFHKAFILQFVKSYRMLKIDFLARCLNIKAEECEWYLVQMILDGEVIGKIDQVEGILDLTQSGTGGGKKYAAMQVWAGTLSTVSKNLPQPKSTITGGMSMTYFS